MRLTAISNGPKRTISTSGGFGMLQMVLEPNTGQCASEDVGTQGGGLCDPTSVQERNEAFLIRVWKSLPGIRVLKSWYTRFKIVRLTVIRDGPKRTTSAGSAFRLGLFMPSFLF